MKTRRILLFFLFVLPLLSPAQRVDSLVTVYIRLPEEQKNDPFDSIAPFLLYQLTLSYTEDSHLGEFSLPLLQMLEKRALILPKEHPLAKTYKRYQATAINDLGMYYREKGDVLRALEFFHKSLIMFEELRYAYYVGESYNNLATVYFDIGDKAKALEFYKKSYDILKNISGKSELLQVLANVAYMYYSNGYSFTALKYYDVCLRMAEEVGDKKFVAECINGMGLIYFKLGNLGRSLNYFERSLNIREEIHDMKGVATTLNNLGNYYRRTGNYKEALKFSLLSFDISQELGSLERMRQAAFGLKDIYEKLGNYKEALKMNELYIQMRDSNNNEITRKAALERQLGYEYDKKKIIMKQEQERIKNLYEQKQKFYLILTIVLVILVIIVFYSLYLRYRFKKEEESKNLHIELKERLKKEIKEKERIANSIINIQEKEREKLAAELHDGVNQLLFAGKIQLQAAKKVDEEMYREGVKLIDTAINEIRSIAGNQGSFLLNNRSLKEALTNLVQQMKGGQSVKIQFADHGFDEQLLQQEQKINILRIIQELLNNSVRHSKAQNCYIAIKSKKNKIIFAVSDTGKGIDSGKESNGHGIKNIHNKVALMKGKLRIFSLKNIGSKIFVEIPIFKI